MCNAIRKLAFSVNLTDNEQTFLDPATEVLPTIQDSVRSVNTTGLLLRFADILVQPPAP